MTVHAWKDYCCLWCQLQTEGLHKVNGILDKQEGKRKDATILYQILCNKESRDRQIDLDYS